MRAPIPHSRPTLDETDMTAVAEVVGSGHISQGPKVNEFEKAMASFIGLRGAVSLSSGTVALHLSLLSIGIKNGDEVIIPSYVCPALLNAVLYVGATPRLAEIEPETFNIDPYKIERLLRKRPKRRPKAIILTHTFGHPADLDAFMEISRRYEIPIIEDCAQALGATYKGKMVGSVGLISILSFYATKIITTGEGGMLLSDSEDTLKIVRDIREYDEKEDFKVRYNYKMTDIAAALGLSQLKRLPSFLKRRKEIATAYNDSFSGIFLIPEEKEGCERIYYRYILRSPHVDRLIRLMEKDRIVCRRPIFKPIHQYIGEMGFPNSEMAWERSISIPIYPGLGDEEVRRITDSLIRARKMIGG